MKSKDFSDPLLIFYIILTYSTHSSAGTSVVKTQLFSDQVDYQGAANTISSYMPTSSDSFLQYKAEFRCILCPVAVLPVNVMRGISGCVTIASPTFDPKPNTIFTTPGGIPTSIIVTSWLVLLKNGQLSCCQLDTFGVHTDGNQHSIRKMLFSHNPYCKLLIYFEFTQHI